MQRPSSETKKEYYRGGGSALQGGGRREGVKPVLLPCPRQDGDGDSSDPPGPCSYSTWEASEAGGGGHAVPPSPPHTFPRRPSEGAKWRRGPVSPLPPPHPTPRGREGGARAPGGPARGRGGAGRGVRGCRRRCRLHWRGGGGSGRLPR